MSTSFNDIIKAILHRLQGLFIGDEASVFNSLSLSKI